MEQVDRDLLIRIDERQETMILDLTHMKSWMENAPCKVHNEKVSVIERIVWGSVLVSIGATIKAFWK
jgi:hypothetical protein